MLIILWIVFCFVIGAIAKDRKLGFWGGFFISLILSPLIGLIFALVSDKKTPGVVSVASRANESQEQKRERVKKENVGKKPQGMFPKR